MSQLWTQEFFPKSFEEFIGNSDIVSQVALWAKNWSLGQAQQPLLLFGQSGAGKTALCYLVAQQNDWDLFELNASDFRSKEIIERLAGAAAMNSSFSGKKRLVLLDEVDGLQAQDRGGAGAIVQILREAKNPVVLTANDIFSDQKLAPLRAICRVFEFKKINYLSMAKRLREILAQKNILFDEEAVKLLAKNSEGDLRGALLDLQSLSFGDEISVAAVNEFGARLRTEKIFKVMAKIFHGKSLDEIRQSVFASDVSADFLLRWIEENIPRQLKGDDLSRAFEIFSRADIFNGRIRSRQNYGFLRYSNDLMTAGVGLSKTGSSVSFVPFQFPTLLSKLSRSSSARQSMSSIAEKIGQKTHASKRRVMSSDLPFIKQLFENTANAVNITAQFEFDEKEVAFLLGTSPKTKKVLEILEKASELRLGETAPKIVFKMQAPAAKAKPQKIVLPKEDSSKQSTLF